jgi:hypothetical protein
MKSYYTSYRRQLSKESLLFFVLTGATLFFAAVVALAQSNQQHFKFEAESGNFSGQAITASDSLASGGSYLIFTTSTTPPSPGVQFQSTFETLGDFYDNFDMHTGNYCTGDYPPTCRPEQLSPDLTAHTFPGDHDMNCQGPTTTRTVDISNHSNLFWWCAPGNDPTKGHIMVGHETSGYAIVAFSPKPVFTDVAEVCWDQNMTNLGGGKWFNVQIVPESIYLSHPNLNPRRVEEREGPYRMDYTSPGFNFDISPGDFNIQYAPTFGLKNFVGSLSLWTDNSTDQFVFDTTGDVWTSGDDKATRFKHCMIDNGNGTLTITQARTTGTVSHTVNASLPNGRVKILFQDDTYDSIKHDGRPGFKTWHIDNIIIK